MPALALVSIALAAASSCSKPKDGITLPIGHPAGYVAIANGNLTGVQAEFWKSLSPEPAPTSVSIGDDHCEVLSLSSASSAGITFADVGTALAFTSISNSLVIMETVTDGASFFDEFVSPLPGDEDWTIKNSGGTDLSASNIGTIHTPTAAIVMSPPALTPGTPATVTWTGAGDADAVAINVVGDSAFVQCSAKPDGSFTIPATATATAGPNVFLQNVIPFTEHVVRVDGRELLLQGSTYQ